MRLHNAAVASCEGVSLGAVVVFAAAGFLTTALFLVGAFLLVAGFFTAFAGAALLVAFTAAFLATGFLVGTAFADFFAGAGFFAVARGGMAVTP